MNKRKKPKLGLLIMIGLVVYFGYIIFEQERIWDSKNSQMNAIQEKIKEEENLNAELKKENGNAGSDESVEKTAREKLGMVKPGERIYVDANR